MTLTLDEMKKAVEEMEEAVKALHGQLDRTEENLRKASEEIESVLRGRAEPSKGNKPPI